MNRHNVHNDEQKLELLNVLNNPLGNDNSYYKKLIGKLFCCSCDGCEYKLGWQSNYNKYDTHDNNNGYDIYCNKNENKSKYFLECDGCHVIYGMKTLNEIDVYINMRELMNILDTCEYPSRVLMFILDLCFRNTEQYKGKVYIIYDKYFIRNISNYLKNKPEMIFNYWGLDMFIEFCLKL